MNRCQFIKSDGTRCEANSVNDSEYCFSHNPDFKDAKLAAVIRGGLNRKHYEAYGEPIVIEKPEDIKKLLAETIINFKFVSKKTNIKLYSQKSLGLLMPSSDISPKDVSTTGGGI